MGKPIAVENKVKKVFKVVMPTICEEIRILRVLAVSIFTFVEHVWHFYAPKNLQNSKKIVGKDGFPIKIAIMQDIAGMVER